MDSVTSLRGLWVSILLVLTAGLAIVGCDDGSGEEAGADMLGDTAPDEVDLVEGACGAARCNLHQACDESGLEPVCRCLEGYAGEDCTACATGWVDDGAGGCMPGELDCVAQPFTCRPHGGCVIEGGRDRCVCEVGYGGRFCERCADGYQDHGAPGVCAPGCALANLSCAAPQVCDDGSGTPQCACPRGTTGASCELCAAGYRRAADGGCAASCALVQLECPQGQGCVDTADGAACGCPLGTTGADCSACAAGWVASAEAGCLPGCAVLESLGGCLPQSCSEDARGVGQCSCAPGFAGVACERCAFGHEGAGCAECSPNFVRLGDGPCHATCNWGVIPMPCPGASYCWEGEAMEAVCVCEPGYGGAGCASCESGFVAEGELCQPEVASAEDVLVLAQRDDALHLATLASSTGELRLLHRLEPPFSTSLPYGGLVRDPTTGRFWLLVYGTLASFDPATGAFEVVTDQLHPNTRTLTRTPAGVLYSHVGDDIVSIDPVTGQTTLVVTLDSSLYNVGGIAWRESTGTLLLRQHLSILEIDPATGAVTTLTTLADNFPIYPHDLTVLPSGELLLSGWRTDPGYEEQVRECRVMAHRLLGDALYADAPGQLFESEALEVLTVSSAGDSAQVLAVDVTNEAATVVIDTAHAGDVVCVRSYVSTPPTVRLAAGAQVRAVVLNRPDMVLELESGFAPAQAPLVYVHQGSQSAPLDPSLEAQAELVRVYDEDAWEMRGLGAALGGRPRFYHQSAAVRLDATGSSVLEVMPLPGVETWSVEPWSP